MHSLYKIRLKLSLNRRPYAINYLTTPVKHLHTVASLPIHDIVVLPLHKYTSAN